MKGWSPRNDYDCVVFHPNSPREVRGTMGWYDVVRLVYQLDDIAIEQRWRGSELLVHDRGERDPKWIVPLPLPRRWTAGRLTA